MAEFAAAIAAADAPTSGRFTPRCAGRETPTASEKRFPAVDALMMEVRD